MTSATLIPHAGLAISLWHNHAGRKADIASGPGWLIGYAFLDQDAPFSDYSGHDRTITLVEGPGFTLAGPGRDDLVVTQPYRPNPFDGGWLAQCRIAGPCRVLNAMTARATHRHSVEIHAAAGLRTVEPAGDICAIVVVLAGEASASGTTATRLDALRIEAPTSLDTAAGTTLAGFFISPPA